MKAIALVLALFAGPVAAQQLSIDSTFDPYSRTARVWISSELLPTEVPGLAVYVTAKVVIGRSTDTYLPYTATCRTWVGFSQEESGEYWAAGRIPIDLLVREAGQTSGARLVATRDDAVPSPRRERSGDLAFRLTRQRQTAMAMTAQIHRDASTAYLVEFPPEFFDTARAVLARADSALSVATGANRVKADCH